MPRVTPVKPTKRPWLTKPAKASRRTPPDDPADPPQPVRGRKRAVGAAARGSSGTEAQARAGTQAATAGSRGSVRIIAGGWRGRRVSFPALPGLRPTPDRVRETLFNWLQQAVVGVRCLDLFAGSGALGLEALSRGAKEVVFVEQAQAAARGLVAQLALLNGQSRSRVVEMGASRFLRTSAPPSAGPFERPFDVVFLDPPFGSDALLRYIPLVDAGDWVRAGGFVYLENERDAGVPALPPHWRLLKSKSAGDVGYHLVHVAARM